VATETIARDAGGDRLPRPARGMQVVLVVAVALGLLLTLVVALPGRPAQAAAGPGWSIGHPYTGDFPDPDVLQVGTTYYAYSTSSSGGHIPVTRSTDGAKTWVAVGDALPTVAGWAEDHDTWAPGVAFIGGRYVMFYAAPFRGAGGAHCISRAVSSSPTGPFTDSSSSPLVCQLPSGGSIDPSPFIDVDGSVWLLYKSEGVPGSDPTRFWSQRLTPDGGAVAGDPVLLAQTSQPWEVTVTENPSMIVYGGSYWLFYSGGDWQSAEYAIGYAICSGPAGPCQKPTDRPLLAAFDSVLGPGGPTPFVDQAGHMQLGYHAWTAPNTSYPVGYRALHTSQVTVIGDRLQLADDPDHGDSTSGGYAISIQGTRSGEGYNIATTTGAVAALGDARFYGSMRGARLAQPVVGMALTPTGNGYWLVAADGGIFTFGDARFFGSTGDLRLKAPIAGMAATSSGNGYWLVAKDGGIFTFGDAVFRGSTGALVLAQPVMGMAPTSSGNGYWLVAADGGIFTFGDAPFRGSMGGVRLRLPISGVAPSPSGNGYWMVALDGGIFTFGDAGFYGSGGSRKVSGFVSSMSPRPSGDGYWLTSLDGGVYAFGRAPAKGSSG
jgi:hypothetical protein